MLPKFPSELADPAKLTAGNQVFTRHDRLEGNGYARTGYNVLLHPHRGNPETVYNVFGCEMSNDRLVHGQIQTFGDDVILSVRVFAVETQRVGLYID